MKKKIGVVAITLLALGSPGFAYGTQVSGDEQGQDDRAIEVFEGGAAEQELKALTESEQEDLALAADSEGVTINEAFEQFGWQDAFSGAAKEIKEDFPEQFAASEISNEYPPVGTIWFKDAVPEGLESQFSDVPKNVDIKLVGGELLSAEEVDEVVIAAHEKVNKSDQVDDLVTSYDRESKTVEVVAEPSQVESSSKDQIAQEEKLEDSVLPLEEVSVPTGVSVDVTLDPELRNSGEARHGGGQLEVPGRDRLSCTAGFNVRTASGATAVGTAGHCFNDLTHENVPGAPETRMVFGAEHRGQWGDFQWHTTADTEPSSFYFNVGATANSRRDVLALGFPVVGQQLCRFGRRTGLGCNIVDNLSVCGTLTDGVTQCRMTRMRRDTAEFGDSGGPWYWGGTAYGFHVGQSRTCPGATTCDLFSSVTFIDDALGVTVMTS